MHAVVLVGGFGTRLRPLTNRLPKPVLPVANRPMIARLIERLGAGGISDVVLALGFAPEPFRDAFPTGTHAGVRLHYVVEPEPLDTGGAIAFAARSAGLDETFVALNGDILSDLDIGSIVAAHRSGDRDATLHLVAVPDPSAFGVVELDDAGCAQRFVEKPAPGETNSNLISAGAYVLEPAVLDLIAPDQRVSIERDVFPTLVERRRLFGHATNGYWLDAGRPPLYLQANLDRLDGIGGPAEDGIASEATIDPTASIERSVIGPACRVDANATVRNSVLLGDAVVESGAAVVGSIVAGHVGQNATVTDCVLGETGVAAAGLSLSAMIVPEPNPA